MKVAIVGSGPTGRAAARELATNGVAVTIFEKESEPGGLMRWGYPDFRMPISVTQRDVAALRELGVTFRVETALGEHVSLAELERDYDAVLITTGAPRPKRLGIPGEDSPGVHSALQFLHAARSAQPLSLGRDVLVLGGGDTAVDAAVTAVHGGSGRVTILYRGPEENISAQPHELQRSRDAGVNWRFRAPVHRIEPADSGVIAVVGHSVPSQNSRLVSERVDSIIVAIGQESDAAFLDRLGVSTRQTQAEGRPKVHLAGGSRYGSDRLAKAIQDGRAVARNILESA